MWHQFYWCNKTYMTTLRALTSFFTEPINRQYLTVSLSSVMGCELWPAWWVQVGSRTLLHPLLSVTLLPAPAPQCKSWHAAQRGCNSWGRWAGGLMQKPNYDDVIKMSHIFNLIGQIDLTHEASALTLTGAVMELAPPETCCSPGVFFGFTQRERER